MSEVTQVLRAIGQGDERAAEPLLPLIYDGLRRLATRKLAEEKPGQTLQPTALVHEAYLRLLGSNREEPQQWEGRGHFFAAAEALRRILVEAARRKQRLEHGGEFERQEFDEALFAIEAPTADVLALDEALDEFAREEPRKAEFVKLRYFAGRSEQEAAAALGIGRSTASRWWADSKAWLFEWLN
ncbi:MAG: ECF-type sigma factor [Planctomycetota bacterium]|nr:ECF-type sigma factor [Planctomycetota bacterium]